MLSFLIPRVLPLTEKALRASERRRRRRRAAASDHATRTHLLRTVLEIGSRPQLDSQREEVLQVCDGSCGEAQGESSEQQVFFSQGVHRRAQQHRHA